MKTQDSRIVVQTEIISVRFRRKFRLEICFGFGVSAFSIFSYSAETLLWAEIDYFGQKIMLLPNFFANNLV